MSVEVRAFGMLHGMSRTQKKSERKKNYILSNKIHNKIASSLWQTIFNGISVKILQWSLNKYIYIYRMNVECWKGKWI